VVEIPLVATPRGECNCISIHKTGSVHFRWANISRVNSVVSGPTFTNLFVNVERIVVDMITSFSVCR